jgi:hypothetical protein
LTLLWLGRASELSLLSLYATVGSDASNLLETNTDLSNKLNDRFGIIRLRARPFRTLGSNGFIVLTL